MNLNLNLYSLLPKTLNFRGVSDWPGLGHMSVLVARELGEKLSVPFRFLQLDIFPSQKPTSRQDIQMLGSQNQQPVL